MNAQFDTDYDTAQEQVTTASEIVRQFGLWQERAGRSPVYILHRGRPRHVLASVELMQALCGTRAGESDERPLTQTLLDQLDDAALTADAMLRISGANAAARALFGAQAAASAPAAALVTDELRGLWSERLARVLASGAAEQIELASPRDAQRRLHLRIAPLGDGLALFVRDVSVADERDDAEAAVTAVEESVASVPDAALARLNPRGYLAGPARGLSALTGVADSALGSVRFVSLFTIASRVAVGEALDAVLGDGRPRHLVAAIALNGGGTRPVALGLAALRHRFAITGAVATLYAADRATHG